jgi:hypothetical protein
MTQNVADRDEYEKWYKSNPLERATATMISGDCRRYEWNELVVVIAHVLNTVKIRAEELGGKFGRKYLKRRSEKC